MQTSSATKSAGTSEDVVVDGDAASETGGDKSTTSKYVQFCVTQADLVEEMDKVKAAGVQEDDSSSSEMVLALISEYEKREEEEG